MIIRPIPFFRGVRLAGHKSRTRDLPIEPFSPAEVAVPLSRHLGAPAVPLVQTGDLVRKGQTIGALAGKVSANVHASVSGTVKAVGERPDGRGGTMPCVVIAADGRAPGWTTRSVSFQIPGMVPAQWRFPILEKLPPLPANPVAVSAEGKDIPLFPMADLYEIFNDEYWQMTMPDMLRNAVGAIRARTQAHTAAKASLAAALAAPDSAAKPLAVATAAAAVAATKDISMDNSDWRRWATVPRRFLAAHFPIPKDRTVNLYFGQTKTVTLRPETHRAVIYLRKLDDACVPHVWESGD